MSTPYEVLLEANGLAQVRVGGTDEPDPWAGSPFGWVMRLSARRRGRAGELLAEAWLEALGFDVGPPSGMGHDRVVNDRKVEIKFSTLWEAGQYVFQQLRDQDYEFVVMLGVSPVSASCWIVPKAEAFARAIPQHGGAGGVDTKWLRINATSPPPWMAAYGGDLADAQRAAAAAFA